MEVRSVSFCGGGFFNFCELGIGGIDIMRIWKVGVYIVEIDCYLCVGDEFRNCIIYDCFDWMGIGIFGIF